MKVTLQDHYQVMKNLNGVLTNKREGWNRQAEVCKGLANTYKMLDRIFTVVSALLFVFMMVYPFRAKASVSMLALSGIAVTIAGLTSRFFKKQALSQKLESQGLGALANEIDEMQKDGYQIVGGTMTMPEINDPLAKDDYFIVDRALFRAFLNRTIDNQANFIDSSIAIQHTSPYQSIEKYFPEES